MLMKSSDYYKRENSTILKKICIRNTLEYLCFINQCKKILFIVEGTIERQHNFKGTTGMIW